MRQEAHTLSTIYDGRYIALIHGWGSSTNHVSIVDVARLLPRQDESTEFRTDRPEVSVIPCITSGTRDSVMV